MTPEKSYENKIKSYLKSQGCWFVKYFANRMTKAGIPDLLTCINGFFVAIEVKADHGKPDELQLWNRAAIRNANGISIVLYPDQFDDFKMMVQDLLHYPNHIDTIRTEQKTFDRD